MNPGRQIWFFLLAFVLLAGLLAGCNGKNNKESGGQTHTKIARGEIKAVNRDKRKIILKLASAAKTESTTEQTGSTTQQGGGTTSFHVAQNAKITVLGKEAQLTDLKAGQQAEIQYSVQKGGANKAVNVNVTGQPSVAKKVTGEIKKVNLDTKKIWVRPSSAAKTGSTTQQGGGTTSFHVAQNAKITVLGKEAQLTDLKAGQQAEIQYSVQKGGANKAVNVNVTGQPSVAKKVTGEIKKVNLDTKKIWVRPSSEQDKIISFKILPGATIMVNSQNAKLADLKAGQQAQIQYFIKEGINRARSVKVSGTAAVSGPTPG